MQSGKELLKQREELINGGIALRGLLRNVPTDFLFSNDSTKLYFIAPEEKGNKSSLFSSDIQSQQKGNLS
jgi:hypothetical protein